MFIIFFSSSALCFVMRDIRYIFIHIIYETRCCYSAGLEQEKRMLLSYVDKYCRLSRPVCVCVSVFCLFWLRLFWGPARLQIANVQFVRIECGPHGAPADIYHIDGARDLDHMHGKQWQLNAGSYHLYCAVMVIYKSYGLTSLIARTIRNFHLQFEAVQWLTGATTSAAQCDSDRKKSIKKQNEKKKNAKCSGLSIAWIAPVLSFAPDRRFSTVFEIGCTDYAHMNHRVGHISISKCTPVKCTNWSLSTICILLFALPQRATQHKLNGPMHSKIDVARCAMSAQIGDRSSPASSIDSERKPHARARY